MALEHTHSSSTYAHGAPRTSHLAPQIRYLIDTGVIDASFESQAAALEAVAVKMKDEARRPDGSGTLAQKGGKHEEKKRSAPEVID